MADPIDGTTLGGAHPPHRRRVLMFEDDPDDVRIAELANQRRHEPWDLAVAFDATEALANLRTREHPPELLPELILVDLSMPVMDGVQVLRELATRSALASVPRIVLTTSHAATDIQACYAAGCHSFIAKPMRIAELSEIFDVLHRYWFEVVLAGSAGRRPAPG